LTTLVDLANLPEPQGSDPRILIERARAYDALGAFPDEKKSAEQAQLGAAAKGAHLLEAEADVSLCWAEDNLGNDNGAVIACQQADEIYHRFADTLGVARAQNNLAHTLMDKSDFQGALAKYRMAAELTESIGARKDYAGALLNVAKMQSYLDQSADAEISLKQVMALAGEISDNDTLGKAYLALADLAHTNGEVARAQELVTAELKLAEGDADQDAIARAHSFLASYGLESGNLGAAITSADKCIELRSKAEMPGGVAYCQQTRGDILLAQNHLSEAQTAYQAAAQLYEKATQPGNAAAVWMAQAELNVETGRAADGETLARKAWIEFQKEQDTDMQASALSALLHALIAQQKTAEAAQSWSALEKLRPKDPDVQLETEIAEARYRSMSGNFDTALERTEQVRDSCTKRGRVDCELQARLLAGQVRLAAGRRDGLAADLQGLSGEASKLGFNLIAEEATRLLAGQATAHAP
jgi:tetratricopeptide (TPR) repeat protein